LKHWAKLDDNIEMDRVAEWFPLFLSMLGDAADSIPGLKGVGSKTIVKHLDSITKTYGNDPDNMYTSVMEGKDVLAESFQYVKTVTSRKIFGNHNILKRNMKLISFRALSEWLNGGYPLDTIEKKRYIETIFHNTSKLKDYKVIVNALSSKGLGDVLNEKTVERCFSVT
jgi:5'-3' exonuclease